MNTAVDQRYVQAIEQARQANGSEGSAALWALMREEAAVKAAQEPILGSYFHATVLNHKSFGSALSFRLASKLDNPMLPTMLIRDVITEAIETQPGILGAAALDIVACYTRDPACEDLSTPFLRGEPVELHQVMAAAEEASLSLELLVETRNKLTDAYRTLMNLQV
jgi:hypothetical protein